MFPLLCFLIFWSFNAVAGSTNDCTTFSINGSTPNHFNYYRFYDFRNISTTGPPQDGSNSSNDLPRAKVMNDSSWTDDWNVRVQSKEAPSDTTIALQYNASNVYIDKSTDSTLNHTSYLTLCTTRLNSTQQVAGEIDYAETNVSHASIRMLARVTGASGAVAGFFTYHNDTTESDIEILTRDQGNVHYSNQPTTTDSGATVAGSSQNVTLPSSKRTWEDWHVYRLDWLSGASQWWVNGKQAASSNVNIPGAPSTVILNMWSNAGPWAGSMAQGATACLQVQWIEMAFNTSDQAATTSKSVTCSIDKQAGKPVVSGGSTIYGTGCRIWILPHLLFLVWMLGL